MSRRSLDGWRRRLALAHAAADRLLAGERVWVFVAPRKVRIIG